MAELLDLVFLVVFGGWAYLAAKKSGRDEVGWAIAAALAFYIPGYAAQQVVFPHLAEKLGWSSDVVESWRRPVGFIVGGLCGLILDLYATFLLKPLAPSGDQGPPPEEPSGEGGGSAPRPPAAQMTATGEAALDPQMLVARFWPAAIAAAVLAAAFIPALGRDLLKWQPEDPSRDYRFFLLVPVVGLFFWRLRGRPLEGVLAAVLTLAYVPAFGWMQWRWSRGSSYYSHGYLIPLVVGWLIWQQRGRLAELKARDDLKVVGLVVLGLGLLLLLAGTFIRAFFIQGLSLVVTVCGVVFFLCGRAISKRLLFPLLFTVTMVPMPMHVVEKFTFKLKMFAAAASVRVVDGLRGLGLHPYVVVQDGSHLRWEADEATIARARELLARARAGKELPEGVSEASLRTIVEKGLDEIIVGDVCSGLRSLIALLAFGALFAYIAKLSLARKLVLFAAAVPIAILANMWRIVTLTLLACYHGSEATHGWVHDVTGYGIFVVAFILFFTFERVLRKFEAPQPAPAGSGTEKTQ